MIAKNMPDYTFRLVKIYARAHSVKEDTRVLVIEDQNLGGKSVTNGIEDVLEEIDGRVESLPHVVIYRDSNGHYDGVDWKENDLGNFEEFAGFYSLGHKSGAAAAIEAVNRYHGEHHVQESDYL